MSLRLCDCGAKPKYHAPQIAEDAVESWVECGKCGARTEEIEDAYGDYDTSAYNWNNRHLKPDAMMEARK